jgi:hypothetical protein
MVRTWRLKAFLAAACVSVLALDSAAAQGTDAVQPVPSQAPETAAVSPSTDGAPTSGWLTDRQKRVVNPFRATPAPGTPRALQGQTGSLPVAPGVRRLDRLGAPLDPADAQAKVPGCTIGFRRQGTTCVAVEIPENGTLDLTGHAWTCKQGFFRREQSCQPLALPENASLDASGHRWACNYGYRRQDAACVAVVVPENASLDKTGRNWVCNQGYERRNEGCIDDATARLQDQANKVVNARPGPAQAAQRPGVTVNSGENRQGRTSKAKVVIGRF